MPDPADSGDPRLADLLRQRELVASHLAWLDSQIARTSSKPRPPSSPAAIPLDAGALPTLHHVTSTNVETPGSPAKSSLPAVAPRTGGALSRHLPAATDTPPADIDAILRESPSGLTSHDKWGCIAIVLVVGLLILAALFGLPYLLPKFR